MEDSRGPGLGQAEMVEATAAMESSSLGRGRVLLHYWWWMGVGPQRIGFQPWLNIMGFKYAGCVVGCEISYRTVQCTNSSHVG